jgi:hypothetical protein
VERRFSAAATHRLIAQLLVVHAAAVHILDLHQDREQIAIAIGSVFAM